MSLNLSLILFITFANLFLGLWVWLKNPKDKVNQYFGLFSVAVGAWSLSNGFVATYAATKYGYLWARFAFSSASIMPLSFLLFISIFPSPVPVLPRKVVLLFVTGGLGAFVLSLTSFVVKATTSINGTLLVSYGPLYHAVALYMICCFSFSLLLLTKKLQVTRGIQNLQVRYLFLGFFTAGIGATITNLILPLVFGTSYFSQYGPFFSILMMGVIAHSIIRYQLMNIRLVIRRGIAYLLAAATAGGVFVLFVWMTSRLLIPSGSRDLPFEVELAFVLLIALLFQPLKRWFQTWLDRYFFREPYNYRSTIREISRTMGTLLDFKSLLNYICDVMGRTIRPETISIYIRNPLSTGYVRMALRRFIEDISRAQLDATLPETSSLPHLLASSRIYLIRDDFSRVTPNEATGEALRELDRLGGEMALPILDEEQLIGFIVLAPKLSGDAYFAEDIDLLSTLVGQVAIAVKNAQLYQEVALVNEYVANIVATMESGVVAIGANSRVTLFNPAAERITGLSAQEIRSEPTSRLPAALAQSLDSTLRDGQPRVQAETTIPDTSGRYTPVSCSTYALRDRVGTLLGAVAIFSDLTRLKELEGERRRAERLASFGALASGIAHEIKNPLVAIRTFAELLPERFTETDFREDFSTVVIREIQRIDDLVARLRGLAAPSPYPLAPLDLREPIEDTLALLRAQLEQKRIHLRRRYDRSSPVIAGDPAQLKQLFLNLCMNSLEAMEPGGELTIALHPSSNRGTSTVLAKVSDTGSGIIEPLLAKIFDPFVTTKSGGSGLGLAICRGIADAHGATIHAENNPGGRGSTIVVEFPTAIAATVGLGEKREIAS